MWRTVRGLRHLRRSERPDYETVVRKCDIFSYVERYEDGIERAHLGSTLPLRVAPGRPANGVNPIEVSRLLPF